MKLPRLFRPTIAGALLLASQALEDLARRVAPKPVHSDRSDTTPKRPPPPGGYHVAMTPAGAAMLARREPKVTPAEPEPLAGSIEARRREGAL